MNPIYAIYSTTLDVPNNMYGKICANFTVEDGDEFNNDFDGSTYKDPDRKKVEDFNWCYPSSKFGELVPDKKDLKPGGWKGRYVRVYSDKAFYNEGMEARFVEVSVWGSED